MHSHPYNLIELRWRNIIVNLVQLTQLHFRCGATPTGFPLPQYQWWAKGKRDQILGRGHTLILRPVRLTSAGTYHCQPYNSLGKGGVGTAHLSVVQEPRIIAGLPNQVSSRLYWINNFILDQQIHNAQCRW